MPLRPDLRRQAHDFAQRNDLLNRTVADGVRVHALMREDGSIGWVGYRTDARHPYPGEGIPLALARRRPRAFLHVMHTLVLDEKQRFLTAEQSSYGLYLSADLSGCIFQYDYIRQPDNPYPPAHFQVEGSSPELDELFARVGKSGRLGALHFPVGGKRFLPSLEEVVSFLVIEGLAEGRRGWEAAVDTGEVEGEFVEDDDVEAEPVVWGNFAAAPAEELGVAAVHLGPKFFEDRDGLAEVGTDEPGRAVAPASGSAGAGSPCGRPPDLPAALVHRVTKTPDDAASEFGL